MKKNILFIVETAVLLGILILMNFTPIGFLRIGVIEITFMMIPVAIGAIMLGPTAGLILGTAFGLLSFSQCFGASAFGAALLEINPVLAALTCIPTRALAGWLTGFIFKLLRKADKTRVISYYASSVLAALLNTVFFVGTMILCFYRTDYIQSLVVSTGAKNVLLFAVAFVGLNGIVEMIATGVLSGTAAKVLSLSVHKTSDGEYV